jgi:hypothetical protein
MRIAVSTIVPAAAVKPTAWLKVYLPEVAKNFGQALLFLQHGVKNASSRVIQLIRFNIWQTAR